MTLDDLRALEAAATPGPWVASDDHPLHRAPYVGAPGTGLAPDGEYVATTATDDAGQGVRDARLIAAARKPLEERVRELEEALRESAASRHQVGGHVLMDETGRPIEWTGCQRAGCFAARAALAAPVPAPGEGE